MWPTSTALATLSGLPHCGQPSPATNVADVGDDGPGEIAAGDDIAVVVVELVGAADEVLPVLEAAVEDDIHLAIVEGLRRVEADGAQVAGGTVHPLLELFGHHGTQVGGADDGHELGLVDEVVAAQEGHDRGPASDLPSADFRSADFAGTVAM